MGIYDTDITLKMCISLKYGQSKDNYLNYISKYKHMVSADRWIYNGTDLALEPKLLLISVQICSYLYRKDDRGITIVERSAGFHPNWSSQMVAHLEPGSVQGFCHLKTSHLSVIQ